MTAQEIINLALSNTHTKSEQVGAANLLRFFNIARHDLGNTIIKDVDENFFFQIWTVDAALLTDTGRANNEYLFPSATSSNAGLLKLQRLTIKGHVDDLYFRHSQEVDPRSLDHDWPYYLDNQPKTQPIHFIADESFFIAPKWEASDLPATPAGNAQIKLYGIAKLTDLLATALESAILIPTDQHHIIAVGMEQYIYKARGKKKEAFDAILDYERCKQNMIDALTNRDNSSMCATVPDDTNLQFAE